MSMRHLQQTFPLSLLAWAGCLALFATASVAADPGVTASRLVDDHGRLVTARTGALSELFPETGDETQPALAVETRTERLLVPGTDDVAAEHDVHLEWSRNGQRLLVLWRSTDSDGISTIRFASRHDGEWLAPQILRDGDEPIVFTSTPRILSDQQRLVLELDGDDRLEADRHLFHVFWSDEQSEVRYAALLFENGHFAEWNETVSLSTLFQRSHSTSEAKSAHLTPAWSVRPSETGDSILVSLEDPAYHRVGALEISVIAPALGLLSDAIGEHVTDVLEENANEDAPGLADKMRGHIVVIGHRLLIDPAIADLFADRIGEWLVGHADEYAGDVGALAEATRRTALEVSRSVSAVTRTDTSGDDEANGVDFATYLDETGQGQSLSGLIQVHVAADFPAPNGGIDAGTRIHVSEDGSAMALARVAGDRLLWTENRGDGWSSVRFLPLGSDLEAAAAHELVARSIR